MSATPFERINFWVNFSHLNLLSTHPCRPAMSCGVSDWLVQVKNINQPIRLNSCIFLTNLQNTSPPRKPDLFTTFVWKSASPRGDPGCRDLEGDSFQVAREVAGHKGAVACHNPWIPGFKNAENPVGCVGCKTSNVRVIPTKMEAKMRES